MATWDNILAEGRDRLLVAPWIANLGGVEAEINPLFVLPEGQGVRAADGLAVLA